MGVVVVRGFKTGAGLAQRSWDQPRPAAPRAYDQPSGSLSYARRGNAGMHLLPAPSWWPRTERRTFWGRMTDDRELIAFKTLMLTSLLLVAAMLEWVG